MEKFRPPFQRRQKSRGQRPLVAVRRRRNSFPAPAGAYSPKTEQEVRNARVGFENRQLADGYSLSKK